MLKDAKSGVLNFSTFFSKQGLIKRERKGRSDMTYETYKASISRQHNITLPRTNKRLG